MIPAAEPDLPSSSAPVGIPYAWTDPDTGARTCPDCGAVIAEAYDVTGEQTTSNYVGHWTAEHGEAGVPAEDDPRAVWLREPYGHTPDMADYLLAADGFGTVQRHRPGPPGAGRRVAGHLRSNGSRWPQTGDCIANNRNDKPKEYNARRPTKSNFYREKTKKSK